MKKNMISICLILIFVLVIVSNNIFAVLGNGFDKNKYDQVTSNANIEKDFSDMFMRIYSTASLIIKIVSVAGVVFTGVKYMYAEANDKAQIKQTLVFIIIGVIFVFSADAVINFVMRMGNSVLV